jgi:SAM-dependent methyltransferase
VFERRLIGAEHMDDTAFGGEEAAACFRFIEQTNRFFGGIRPVRDFLLAETARMHGSRVLRVLDIGSGTCDVPMAALRSAERRGTQVEMTCVERNATALQIAQEHLQGQRPMPLRLCAEDAFSHQPANGIPYDCAVACMFFHHLDAKDIDRCLAHLRRIVDGRLLICDLRRTALAYAACWLWTRPWPRVVRDDALMSIRKGFRARELGELLGHLPGVRLQRIRLHSPLRLSAVVDLRPRTRETDRSGSSH